MPTVKMCSRCGAQFPCGALPGQSRCWCAELPPIMPLAAEGDCFCPECLRAEIEARLTANAPSVDDPSDPTSPDS